MIPLDASMRNGGVVLVADQIVFPSSTGFVSRRPDEEATVELPDEVRPRGTLRRSPETNLLCFAGRDGMTGEESAYCGRANGAGLVRVVMPFDGIAYRDVVDMVVGLVSAIPTRGHALSPVERTPLAVLATAWRRRWKDAGRLRVAAGAHRARDPRRRGRLLPARERAHLRPEADLEDMRLGKTTPFVVAGLTYAVLGVVTGLFVVALDVRTPTAGAMLGLLTFVGFNLSAFVRLIFFEDRPVRLVLIDGGADLATHLVFGLVLSLWR